MHPTLLPSIVVVNIQPQNILVEHSVPLTLFQPQEHPLAVVKTAIPHPRVELVDQSQGHDLLNNNLGSLRKGQSKFL